MLLQRKRALIVIAIMRGEQGPISHPATAWHARTWRHGRNRYHPHRAGRQGGASVAIHIRAIRRRREPPSRPSP